MCHGFRYLCMLHQPSERPQDKIIQKAKTYFASRGSGHFRLYQKDQNWCWRSSGYRGLLHLGGFRILVWEVWWDPHPTGWAQVHNVFDVTPPHSDYLCPTCRCCEAYCYIKNYFSKSRFYSDECFNPFFIEALPLRLEASRHSCHFWLREYFRISHFD